MFCEEDSPCQHWTAFQIKDRLEAEETSSVGHESFYNSCVVPGLKTRAPDYRCRCQLICTIFQWSAVEMTPEPMVLRKFRCVRRKSFASLVICKTDRKGSIFEGWVAGECQPVEIDEVSSVPTHILIVLLISWYSSLQYTYVWIGSGMAVRSSRINKSA